MPTILYAAQQCKSCNYRLELSLIASLPTRGHAYKLYKSKSSNFRAIFACEVVNVWNSLPDTVGFTSLAAFKKSIRTVDFGEFLKCNYV